MPSVRDRIDAFEGKGKKCNNDSPEENSEVPLKRRAQRFLFPGSSKAGKQEGGSNHALEQWTRPSSGSSRSPPGFEAGLEEVWSIQKNIGVNVGRPQGGQGPGVRVGGGMATGLSPYGAKVPSQHRLYSRHSAMSMAAQPASQGRTVGAARSTTLMKKSSDLANFPVLRDQNTSAESGKRKLHSPAKEFSSTPQAKRKTFNALGLLPDSNTDKGNRKLRYAEKMAAAHRKAAGLGEFAPEKNTSYVKIRGGQGDASSKWSRQDSNTVDDEFDF